MGNYLAQVRAELRHVTWPTRRMTIVYTAVVIVVSVGVAIYLGMLDYFFALVVRRII